jgi:hypothetical protein
VESLTDTIIIPLRKELGRKVKMVRAIGKNYKTLSGVGT